MITISRLINAFFRWEFNSCESLVRGTEVYPIDYANACPDVAVTSLHYYFPWAMAALLRWTRVLRGHRPPAAAGHWTRPTTSPSPTTRPLRYAEKLAAYRRLADDYFERRRYQRVLRTGTWATSTRSCTSG